MIKHTNTLVFAFISFLLFSCASNKPVYNNKVANDTLPAAYATKSVMNFSNVTGWEDGLKPKAPEGFEVNPFYGGLENPRWLYELPNGDILVAESNSNHSFLEQFGAIFIGANKSNNLKKSADRISLLKDTNNDGTADERHILVEDLNQPLGMLLMNDYLYIANTEALVRYNFKVGETKLTGKSEKIMDFPSGKHNRHWTRNIIANKDESKIYVAIGSGSNVAEYGVSNEILRADILEINPDGSAMRIFADGIRNPVGMDWNPDTGELWTVVNERDELGDNLVPDYLTHVEENGFYGWPYVYFGQHDDPRIGDDPAVVKNTIVPDYALGAHTASLGLQFYKGDAFPSKYRNGAFIAQHGSWNRSTLAGYKVIFVPFKNGKPAGNSEDFLTGFVENLDKEKVHGRPVCVIQDHEGNLLVTDDTSGMIWRVSAK
ncbi:PQQ-dependent sugar dehydrogenase [Fulvivirga ligni]|uniref:PQQ-dependent sugar dehydrogenase n=1 Tax=Fulvivirga ligni TaxID=2904246 RepID=UPI001F2985BB|nr:sorbosone dehydrogenase family protein [Fulvivirga ligni]UII19443.1 sorbosone dehydrogenase family protein [Fulvivirga ligni]